MIKKVLLALMLFTIVAVNLYDCYLTKKYESTLRECEENPIARAILASDNWNADKFIFLKLCGTFVVAFTIGCIYTVRENIGFAVSVGVTSWQIFLVTFYLGFNG